MTNFLSNWNIYFYSPFSISLQNIPYRRKQTKNNRNSRTSPSASHASFTTDPRRPPLPLSSSRVHCSALRVVVQWNQSKTPRRALKRTSFFRLSVLDVYACACAWVSIPALPHLPLLRPCLCMTGPHEFPRRTFTMGEKVGMVWRLVSGRQGQRTRVFLAALRPYEMHLPC